MRSGRSRPPPGWQTTEQVRRFSLGPEPPTDQTPRAAGSVEHFPRSSVAAEKEHRRSAMEPALEGSLDGLSESGALLVPQDHDCTAAEARTGQSSTEDAIPGAGGFDDAVELGHRDLIQVAQGFVGCIDAPPESDMITAHQGRARLEGALHLANDVARTAGKDRSEIGSRLLQHR